MACFGDAFTAAVSDGSARELRLHSWQIPKFRIYAEYATKWTQTLALLTKLKKHKPFASFIAVSDCVVCTLRADCFWWQSVDAAQHHSASFDNLLSTPLARMAFYESSLAVARSMHDRVDGVCRN
jgi:hypothetical protein